MLEVLVVRRYRSLRDIAFEPRALTLITGANPALLEPLARAIVDASQRTQVWVVSHSPAIASIVREHDTQRVCDVELVKSSDGATHIREQGVLDRPAWP
jgi:predicted ATPase